MPTTILSLDGVRKRHADQQILDSVTVGIGEGERVGVIGRNGSGKSTLLRIMAGVEEPDAGRVVTANRVRVSFVPQDPALDPGQTLAAAVLAGAGTREAPAARVVRAYESAAAALAAAPHEPARQEGLEAALRAMDAEGGWDLERRAAAVLDRLGLTDPDRPVEELSGGQRRRVALAAGLAAPSELLVLDEPTNHLDVDVVEWLESDLRARSGALVLVTHDRYLLDRLATRILEIVEGRVVSGHGSYGEYLEARAVRQEQAAAAERRRANRARTELEWLRRSPAARTSKDRVRVERAERLLASAPGPAEAELDVAMPSRRLGSKVVELHRAGKRYGQRWVLRGIDQRLAPDARIGVVGPNGAGKTTLLALIAGRLEPDEGRVVHGDTVVPGWYGQDPEPLPATQRVVDAVTDVALEAPLPDGGRASASQLLERFGFPAALQRAWVGELSGGERRRLELLRVLATTPNLLLLDEPTNDLDLDTLGVLEEFLDVWKGALVVASHDRYFLDRTCHDIFSVEPGGSVRHHPGGWSAWRASRTRTGPQPPEQPSPASASPAPARRPPRLGFNERRELAALERRMRELEERKAALTAALQEAGADYESSRSTGERLAGVMAELDAAESRWLELAELAG